MSTSSLEDASYVTAAEADTFFTGKTEYAAWTKLDQSRKTSELSEATRRLDAEFIWHGMPATTGQTLRWPRIRVRNAEGELISSSVIPREVKLACLEQAFYQISGNFSAAGKLNGTGIRSVSAGGLSVTIDTSRAGKTPEVTPRARMILRGLGYCRSSTPAGFLFRG